MGLWCPPEEQGSCLRPRRPHVRTRACLLRLCPPLWTSCVPRKERCARPGPCGRWKRRSTAPRAQMNPNPNRQKPNQVTFRPPAERAPWKPNWTGLRQSEKQAYGLILDCLEQEDMAEPDKLQFLRAVDTLCGAVRAQAGGTMNDYLPKTVLAKTIEALILEEAGERLTSSVCQQAMHCIVALSQVDPPFSVAQKLGLVSAALSRVFPLPPIAPSLDRKDSGSLYLQTIQALDDMLQALVVDRRGPDMALLQKLLEIILPWLTTSEKEQEHTRALGTVSRVLRFSSTFPELLHMEDFSVSGRLMGILGIFCMNPNHDVSMGALEGLHYLFKILVLHRRGARKTEMVLRNLQKHFRGMWLVAIQDFEMVFRKYLAPEERADVILVLMEAVASARESDVGAASQILRAVLRSSEPDVGKVPEMVQYVCRNMNSVPQATAEGTVNRVLQLLAQAYTDDVILTLFGMQDQSPRGRCRPWEILASSAQCYEVVMEHLLQRLTPRPRPGHPESSNRTHISPLLATRAIRELLLQPSRRTEVQMLFSPLFVALLTQASFLVAEGGAEWTDPLSSTVEALKTLIQSAGYGDHVTYVQRLGGWELLASPETHHEGVALLARAMVAKSCWHNRPVFSLIVTKLQDLDCRKQLPAFVFLTELLQCPEVAAATDDTAVCLLADQLQGGEPASLKLLLRVVENFARHRNTARQLRLLQPYVLRCCSALKGAAAAASLPALRGLVDSLGWPQHSAFLLQLIFTLGPFFEAELEDLRLAAFETYRALLAKVEGARLLFPLKYQVLNLLVLLVLHLADGSLSVAQTCRLALRHVASILRWPRLKATFAERDVWTVLRALLRQEAGRALWFLKQSVILFKSPQAPIRQAAVWFTGQIIQTLDEDGGGDVEEACTALKSMREDPDPAVGCLATQTLYVIEAKERLPARTPASCLCPRRF